MNNNLIEIAERLNILLQNDLIKSTAIVVDFVDSLEVDNREVEVDREDVKDREEVKELEEEDVEELLSELHNIENYIEELLEINPRLLTTDELLTTNGLVHEYDEAKNKFQISKQIYEGLKEDEDRSLYAWNCDTERYESLKFDSEDYDRLKNLNIVKKLYEKDGWIYKLYFLDKDLRLRPLDNYLLENEDFTMICLCMNGDIMDLRKENWTLVKHPLLREEIVEEIDSAKKVGQWLQDNGYTSDGEKLTKEIMELAEEQAKQKIALYEEAEEILKENGVDLDE